MICSFQAWWRTASGRDYPRWRQRWWLLLLLPPSSRVGGKKKPKNKTKIQTALNRWSEQAEVKRTRKRRRRGQKKTGSKKSVHTCCQYAIWQLLVASLWQVMVAASKESPPFFPLRLLFNFLFLYSSKK